MFRNLHLENFRCFKHREPLLEDDLTVRYKFLSLR